MNENILTKNLEIEGIRDSQFTNDLINKTTYHSNGNRVEVCILLQNLHYNTADGKIQVRINTYPASPGAGRFNGRPFTNGRLNHIKKLIHNALHQIICLNEYPSVSINCYIDLLAMDGSSRIAFLNALVHELILKGVSLKGISAGTSVGWARSDEDPNLPKYYFDLTAADEAKTKTDMPISWVFPNNLVNLLQIEGSWPVKNLIQAINESKTICKQIAEKIQ